MKLIFYSSRPVFPKYTNVLSTIWGEKISYRWIVYITEASDPKTIKPFYLKTFLKCIYIFTSDYEKRNNSEYKSKHMLIFKSLKIWKRKNKAKLLTNL